MTNRRELTASLAVVLGLVLATHTAVAQPAAKAVAQPATKAVAQPAAKAVPAKSTAIKVTEEKPGLLAKAKVSADSAIAIARATIPGAIINAGEIENEDGALIYTFEMKITGKKGTEEVNVDAMTGKVVKREHEDAAAEKKETTADKAAKAKKGKPPV